MLLTSVTDRILSLAPATAATSGTTDLRWLLLYKYRSYKVLRCCSNFSQGHVLVDVLLS